LEKKGEYERSGFEFLRNASERELFYLDKGLTVASAREMTIQLKNIDEKTLEYYTKESDNAIAKWFNNMIKDKTLYKTLTESKTKDTIIKAIIDKIAELEQRKLKKFQINLAKENLALAEEYIINNLSKGAPIEVIRTNLITNGWSTKAVDLILETKSYQHRNFSYLQNIFEVNNAHQNFEELKKKIIIGVSNGLPPKEILQYLKNVGWNNKILNYIITNIYKPKKNMNKLYWYILKEVGDNKKDLQDVKNQIIKTGWEAYIVDHLIHRFNDFDEDLDELLNYLPSFDTEEKERIKIFLKSLGWEETFIERAIKNREKKKFWSQIASSLNLENENSLIFNTELIGENILKLKNTTNAKDFLDEIIKNYKKINLNDFTETNGELHMEREYAYYYSKKDIKTLIELSKKGMLNKLFKNKGNTFYYSSPIKPLLSNLNKNTYLIAPKIIHRECVSCKVLFPINKMTKVEMWDASRTHKVTKFVCKQHESMISSLMDENKFIQ
jgi:hypothetical protein